MSHLSELHTRRETLGNHPQQTAIRPAGAITQSLSDLGRTGAGQWSFKADQGKQDERRTILRIVVLGFLILVFSDFQSSRLCVFAFVTMSKTKKRIATILWHCACDPLICTWVRPANADLLRHTFHAVHEVLSSPTGTFVKLELGSFSHLSSIANGDSTAGDFCGIDSICMTRAALCAR
jgi:hypothetical protein